jgi:predicted dehydrogenase
MAESLGIGVVGLHEGRTMLVALDRAARCHAVAGCDLRPEKIAAARAAKPDLFYTTSYAELLAHPGVQVVSIFTPDALHAEHIVQAFEAGKDVTCTKPLVPAISDARRILEAARRTGRRLLVGQSTRFFESFRRQRAAFERGELGELELVDAHYIHRMDWFYEKSPWASHESDWIFMGMSHPIDLIRWYLGPIDEVHAYGRLSRMGARYGRTGFDSYVVNLRAADGRIARAMGQYGMVELPSARNAIELLLFGDQGTSMAQYHDMRYIASRPDGTEVIEDPLYARRAYYFNNEVHGMHYGEFANYADYFAGCLQEGRPHSPSLEEGLATFCVMEAIRRSAHSGAPVQVRPLLDEIGLAADAA